MRTPPAGRSGRTAGGRGFLCVLEIFCRGRFYIGPQRVEKPPAVTFGSRLRLNCRAGVHARRTADFAKKADVLCFLNLQRFGGRNRPPYDARQTLCHRETIGFFDSLGGRIYIGPVCGGGGPVGNYGPRNYRNICRGRCLHRPGEPCGTGRSPGGPWPSPTNHGK